MRVVAHVLRRVIDDKSIGQQLVTSPALADLVNGFNTIAMVARHAEDESLAVVTGETSGQDFKRFLALLPSRDLHRLLDQYLSHFPNYDKGDLTKERGGADGEPHETAVDTEHHDTHVDTPSNSEDKALHVWLIKAGVVTAVGIVLILLGAMVAIVTHNHQGDNAVFKTIMETATDLLKIILSSK